MEKIKTIAQNYRLFLVDFPTELQPEHLDVPADEQDSLLAGLGVLHTIIDDIYDHFAHLTPVDDAHWANEEYCYRAIEGSVKLLWALGTAGQLIQTQNRLELKANRENLDMALKRSSIKDPKAAFGILEALEFSFTYRDADGLPCTGGYKKCADVAARYPTHNDPLLRAMTYYIAHLPQKKSGRKEKGVIFEVLLRADFRPLLPGYTFHEPHLPATEEEVTRTFSPTTLEVWNALTSFMVGHYPQYQLYFRVPYPRGRRWVADYSIKDNDYGLWSIFVEEGGLSVRIVLIDGTIKNMLEHVAELSPRFQENYLNAVACKDCSHCGKHVFYTHGDHVHQLCKSPWFMSPYLHLEDLPDIERLIDFRLAGVQ